MKYVENRTCPSPPPLPHPQNPFNPSLPVTPQRGSREGEKEGIINLQRSCFLAELAPHAENTHFTLRTGVRAGSVKSTHIDVKGHMAKNESSAEIKTPHII
jgi:hypothetical protein